MNVEREMEHKTEVDLMNKVNVCIWGRDFELPVSYQNYPGEEVTHMQQLTLNAIPSVDYSESLALIDQYIMKYNGSEVNEEHIDNIFKYVMPKSILITRNNTDRIFAVMCNYKFDMEHGLAVVFENEKYKAVGAQDIIL